MTSTSLLSCRGLAKGYPDRLFGQVSNMVFSDLDLTLKAGDIHFLLGLNGAGKTTLLKSLAGFLVRDEGQVFLGEKEMKPGQLPDPGDLSLVQADERSFYQRLKVRDNLDFFASLANLAGEKNSQALDRVIHRFELEELLAKRFHHLSSGQKQRVALARGMLISPRVLLLDEPTRSLDPIAAEALRKLIGDLVASGEVGAILFSSHTPLDIQSLPGKVMVLDGGSLRKLGPLSRQSMTSLKISFEGPQKSFPDLPKTCELVVSQKELPFILVPSGEPEHLAQVLEQIKQSGGQAMDVSGGQADLETWLSHQPQGGPA